MEVAPLNKWSNIARKLKEVVIVPISRDCMPLSSKDRSTTLWLNAKPYATLQSFHFQRITVMRECDRHFLRQRGAALILLVMLIGIGSALLLMGAFRPPTGDLQNELRTQKRLTDASEALTGFATRFGRLPRPAISALDGRESPQPCGSAESCSGFIPWVTLGIDGYDSWGKLLHYAVTPSFTTIPIDAITAGGDKTISSRDDQGNLYKLVGQPGCPVYVQCSPAVIYSSGKKNLGTGVLGIAMSSSVDNNIDERQNEIASNDFISRPRGNDNDAPGGEFDDLVIWMRVQKLYTIMRAAHTLR